MRAVPNGHMVMIEKDNLDIAQAIDDWAQQNVRSSPGSN